MVEFERNEVIKFWKLLFVCFRRLVNVEVPYISIFKPGLAFVAPLNFFAASLKRIDIKSKLCCATSVICCRQFHCSIVGSVKVFVSLLLTCKAALFSADGINAGAD